MKIKNNIVKITTNDGLKKLTRWNNGTYYEPKVEFVIFNINDISYIMSSNHVYVTKGDTKMMLTLTPQAIESLEEIIFKN